MLLWKENKISSQCSLSFGLVRALLLALKSLLWIHWELLEIKRLLSRHKPVVQMADPLLQPYHCRHEPQQDARQQQQQGEKPVRVAEQTQEGGLVHAPVDHIRVKEDEDDHGRLLAHQGDRDPNHCTQEEYQELHPERRVFQEVVCKPRQEHEHEREERSGHQQHHEGLHSAEKPAQDVGNNCQGYKNGEQFRAPEGSRMLDARFCGRCCCCDIGAAIFGSQDGAHKKIDQERNGERVRSEHYKWGHERYEHQHENHHERIKATNQRPRPVAEDGAWAYVLEELLVPGGVVALFVAELPVQVGGAGVAASRHAAQVVRRDASLQQSAKDAGTKRGRADPPSGERDTSWGLHLELQWVITYEHQISGEQVAVLRLVAFTITLRFSVTTRVCPFIPKSDQFQIYPAASQEI